MTDVMQGDRVTLINEGSVFTDEGTLVKRGERGIVVAHRGWTEHVIHWLGIDAYGIAPRSSLAIERR